MESKACIVLRWHRRNKTTSIGASKRTQFRKTFALVGNQASQVKSSCMHIGGGPKNGAGDENWGFEVTAWCRFGTAAILFKDICSKTLRNTFVQHWSTLFRAEFWRLTTCCQQKGGPVWGFVHYGNSISLLLEVVAAAVWKSLLSRINSK